MFIGQGLSNYTIPEADKQLLSASDVGQCVNQAKQMLFRLTVNSMGRRTKRLQPKGVPQVLRNEKGIWSKSNPTLVTLKKPKEKGVHHQDLEHQW